MNAPPTPPGARRARPAPGAGGSTAPTTKVRTRGASWRLHELRTRRERRAAVNGTIGFAAYGVAVALGMFDAPLWLRCFIVLCVVLQCLQLRTPRRRGVEVERVVRVFD